ncbi:MAG: NAD(P)/FAD-dependent oxidoreductase [Vicinamibacteraceae bacterium]
MVDVLIAGAGPAGSLAAIHLARAGARVLMVDRATFPRDKLCGDTLNPGAMRVLDRVGLRSAVEAVSRPLEGMLLTGNGGVHVRGTYGRGLMARALTRRVLDQLLVEAAVAAGVQFQDGVRVDAPMVEETGGRPTVRGAVLCRTAGVATRMRVPARVTIAADGRRSTLAFALGLASHPPAPRRWAVGAYFEGLAGLDTVGEMHVRGPHYIGVSPVGGEGLANVCLVTPDRAGFADPATLLERHLAADFVLGPRAGAARRVTAPSILGPLAVDATAAGVPGLLLAGDAAGFVDPMTGDGLRFALRGAELAADAALAALEDPALDAAARLADARRQAFGTKYGVNRLLRRLIGTPRRVSVMAISARVAPGLLRQMIRYAGDVAA